MSYYPERDRHVRNKINVVLELSSKYDAVFNRIKYLVSS